MNGNLADMVADANAARPASAGGTGGNSVIAGFDGLASAGTTIPSSSTVNLDTATGPLIDISGTTPITAVTLAAGKIRVARATGAFVLTASATLVVNKSTSVNYTTTPGDLLFFRGYSAGQVDVWVAGPQAVATAAQYRSNVAGLVLTTDQVWSAMAPVALTPGTTVSWDMSTGIDFTLAPAQNFTLANATNTQVGKKGRIRIVQDGTGSRTMALGSNYKKAGGTALVLSTAANSVDILYYDCISSTEIDVSLNKAMS